MLLLPFPFPLNVFKHVPAKHGIENHTVIFPLNFMWRRRREKPILYGQCYIDECGFSWFDCTYFILNLVPSKETR